MRGGDVPMGCTRSGAINDISTRIRAKVTSKAFIEYFLFLAARPSRRREFTCNRIADPSGSDSIL